MPWGVNDAALVTAFLQATARMSQDEAGKAVGLSGERIRQFRNGEWASIHAATRRKIEDFLQVGPAAGSPDALRSMARRLRSMASELEELAASAERSPPE